MLKALLKMNESASGLNQSFEIVGIARFGLEPKLLQNIMRLIITLFIWVNSIAGLVGYFTKVESIPSLGLVLAAAAIVGGILGSHLGSRRFAVRVISLLLATVLLIAGMKLLFTR